MKELKIYEIKKPGFHQAVIFESWKVSVFNSAPIWLSLIHISEMEDRGWAEATCTSKMQRCLRNKVIMPV